MEEPQEFGYQIIPTPSALDKRHHSTNYIKNIDNSENKEQFAVEDLFDFSNGIQDDDDDDGDVHENHHRVVVDDVVENDRHHIGIVNNVNGIMSSATTITAGKSTDSSTVTVADSCSAENGFAFENHNFSSDLCVPHDDMAELEWLSNFVEESFSSDDLQKLRFISGQASGGGNQKSSSQFRTTINSTSNNRHSQYSNHPADLISTTTNYSSNSDTPTPTSHSNPVIFNPELTVPAKARSKRSRAAPGNWTSRLLHLSPATNTNSTTPDPAEMVPTPNFTTTPKSSKSSSRRKSCSSGSDMLGSGGEGRKCLHCATDKTPQWRTGPMGPKTLCNACGVRYKSGRLVPEYRPAASPTFVLTKHSNSHRKVMELRRQKEMMRQHQHLHQSQGQSQHQMIEQQFGNYGAGNGAGMIFDVTNGDDYLIHQHVGPDFRQLI